MLLFCRRFAVLQFLCKPWPALRLTDWLISESIVCLSGWTTRRIWIPDEFRTTVWRMWWRQTSGDGDGLRRRLAHVWEIQRRAAVYSDLNISVASLKSTRRRTGSQCNSCRTGEMCLRRPVRVINLAAAFGTDWSRWSKLSVTPYNTELQ